MLKIKGALENEKASIAQYMLVFLGKTARHDALGRVDRN
jgi:hypothetical protein